MVESIDRLQLLLLMDEGAVVIDVLPASEYNSGHIPGALNIPLRSLSRATTQALQRDKPVVVYCHDGL
ncbi:MAG: rhodanese-like domain-containing protein [Acidimicrobiia bacterium]|nr:rhodanese-like domain-containing protein [Acidimicrobiia bacterium]